MTKILMILMTILLSLNGCYALHPMTPLDLYEEDEIQVDIEEEEWHVCKPGRGEHQTFDRIWNKHGFDEVQHACI